MAGWICTKRDTLADGNREVEGFWIENGRKFTTPGGSGERKFPSTARLGFNVGKAETAAHRLPS